MELDNPIVNPESLTANSEKYQYDEYDVHIVVSEIEKKVVHIGNIW